MIFSGARIKIFVIKDYILTTATDVFLPIFPTTVWIQLFFSIVITVRTVWVARILEMLSFVFSMSDIPGKIITRNWQNTI
jgi:hypothetical protein